MTIEQLIEEINLRGLKVNNLFELDSGGWQANVRGPDYFSQFGQGPTPVAALLDLLDRCGDYVGVGDLIA